MKRVCLGRGVDLEEKLVKARLLEWWRALVVQLPIEIRPATPLTTGNLSPLNEVMVKDVRLRIAEPQPWELSSFWWRRGRPVWGRCKRLNYGTQEDNFPANVRDTARDVW
jgi:hypothetical protein